MLPAACVVGRGDGSRAVPANPTKLLPSGSVCVPLSAYVCVYALPKLVKTLRDYI